MMGWDCSDLNYQSIKDLTYLDSLIIEKQLYRSNNSLIECRAKLVILLNHFIGPSFKGDLVSKPIIVYLVFSQ